MGREVRQAISFRARPGMGMAVAQLGICIAFSTASLSAAPFVPASDAEVLQEVPASAYPELRQLRALRLDLDAAPKDLPLAVDLATRYLRLGRANADPRFYGYAQAALSPWWTQPQPPTQVLVLRAVIRQAGHDFTGALADLTRVNEIEPTNAQAWLSRSVIHRVQGDYAQAAQSCVPLFHLVQRLMAIACAASATSLAGQAEQSYALLDSTLLASPTAGSGERVWVLALLADMAIGLGREAAAEKHLREALSLGQRSTTLLSSYADLLLDQDRFEEVRRLLENETEVDTLLLRLAIAERGLGFPTLEDHVERLRAGFEATRARGDQPHLRSEARFLLQVLSRPAEALPLAEANWELQKEPWDARLLLEAALAAGQPERARTVVERLARDQTQHAQLSRLIRKLEASR